ncbi:E3 SUMO-protein ligase PIAS2-like [Drosophila madeirensis]|uniref:E3 SUMO-protein ligase PIAS2-like n=1 Tax=Drosophila madeirensis TaxID=30013 RepID=A0AAU9G1Z2_DROMD
MSNQRGVIRRAEDNRVVTIGLNSAEHSFIKHMVNSIKKRSIVTAASVQAHFLVKNTFAARPDIPNIMVSLKCPVNERKIKVPCRGLDCTHFLCFDAEAYLLKSMCENRWTCPLCHKRTVFEDLFIDGYFQHVLEMLKQFDFEIKVHRDGAWSLPNREYDKISYLCNSNISKLSHIR